MSHVEISVYLNDGTRIEVAEEFFEGNPLYHRKVIESTIKIAGDKVLGSVAGMYGDIDKKVMP